MGDNQLESQSLSLQVWETAEWARGLSVSCMEGSLELGGQKDRQSPQSSRAEPPVTDGKGDQHSGEAPWCVELSCLSSGLEPASVVTWKWCAPPSGSFSVLAPLMASVEFAQEPVYAWS